jgi:hypothetical protein
MAEEGFDNTKETSDPDEDYGLPKIEIKPIQQAEPKQEKQPEVVAVGSVVESARPAGSQGKEVRKAGDDLGSSRYFGCRVVLL